MDGRPALSTLSPDELSPILAELGVPPWRGRQLTNALWHPGVVALHEVLQLPARLRARLDERVRFCTVDEAITTEADSGLTVKLLCRLSGGETVETVAMESPAHGGRRRRATVCVSSQVGCAVGCPFCATGRLGLRRDCTAAEIVDQVRVAGAALHARGLGPVTHVVYMGMGEPLANYDATVASVRTLAAGMGISPRRITVSTSGVVPAIERLAREGLPLTLAISLHAVDDPLRDRLVPLNRAHRLAALVDAGADYARRTGRRLTFEWCLIGGVNDRPEDADGLRLLARRTHAHVNVIPMNRIDGSPWGPPDSATTAAFLQRLQGARTTVRDTRGGTADAGCGQLRAALEERRELRGDGSLGPPRRGAAAGATR